MPKIGTNIGKFGLKSTTCFSTSVIFRHHWSQILWMTLRPCSKLKMPSLKGCSMSTCSFFTLSHRYLQTFSTERGSWGLRLKVKGESKHVTQCSSPCTLPHFPTQALFSLDYFGKNYNDQLSSWEDYEIKYPLTCKYSQSYPTFYGTLLTSIITFFQLSYQTWIISRNHHSLQINRQLSHITNSLQFQCGKRVPM